MGDDARAAGSGGEERTAGERQFVYMQAGRHDAGGARPAGRAVGSVGSSAERRRPLPGPVDCKPGLALAGTGLSRSPGCLCSSDEQQFKSNTRPSLHG